MLAVILKNLAFSFDMTSPFIRQIFILSIFCCFYGCSSRHQSGALPAYMDKYVMTTDQRFFKLKGELTGTILNYQKAYECKDSSLYNSTSIIKLQNNDTITVYSPCLTIGFKVGEKVNVKQVEYDKSKVGNRDIYVQFPKDSKNYPYWLCISCRFPNTMGMVFSATE